ncbi:MAG TPA: carboxypeptidase-like regulatory domain-containing protein [Bryobacteraceae bacterium]|nr:carboxypeptidase-like regulatory domain-containing protein [Bryobacteraceae bacterium]
MRFQEVRVASVSARIFTILGLFAGALPAQQLASLSGVVRAASGSPFPCATVVVNNTHTGKAVTITTGYPAEYKAENLVPGPYLVTVTSVPGYMPVPVSLHTGERLRLDLTISAHYKVSPALARPGPVTLAELQRMKTTGVSAVEVSDYVFGNYAGGFTSPPSADLNPRKAVVIFWKDHPYRLVFSHEASYCPWFELPSGSGLSYQFFEGNEGWAELFNEWGRKERNSHVDVLEAGPHRVWVRWSYLGVNMKAGEAAYRGTEDFWAYPNGLVLRRQTYRTLLPGKHEGYTREPIELIGMCPVGKLWYDVLAQDPVSGESHPLAVLDAFSDARYDVFWKRVPGTLWKATPRRTGADWRRLDDSPGVAMIIPMKDGAPFCIFGDASGFGHAFTRLKEHSHRDTGGIGWVSSSWDHWPIGWLNSQGHEVTAESLRKYPNHFSPMGMDFFAMADEESERGEYYSLMGVGGSDFESIRRLAREWLDKGTFSIARPDSGEDLPSQSDTKRGSLR